MSGGCADDPEADRDAESVRAIDHRLHEHVAADAICGLIEGLGRQAELAIADKVDEPVAQVFALEQHEEGENDHEPGRPERRERQSEQVPVAVNVRRRRLDDGDGCLILPGPLRGGGLEILLNVVAQSGEFVEEGGPGMKKPKLGRDVALILIDIAC